MNDNPQVREGKSGDLTGAKRRFTERVAGGNSVQRAAKLKASRERQQKRQSKYLSILDTLEEQPEGQDEEVRALRRTKPRTVIF